MKSGAKSWVRTRVFAGAVALGVAACGARQGGSADAEAYLRVVASPEQARVFVDDRDVGSAHVLSRYPLPISVGRHRLSIEAGEHFPLDRWLTIAEGLNVVRVTLDRVPPP